MKIAIKRKGISNLEMVLDAYKAIKDSDVKFKGSSLPLSSDTRESKIIRIMDKINTSREILSSLELELSQLEDSIAQQKLQ